MLELQVNSGVIDSISLVMSLVLKEEERGREKGQILLVIFPKPYKKSL